MSLCKSGEVVRAQQRMREFQQQYNASLKECAQLLLIDADNLALFMQKEGGTSMYSAMILRQMTTAHQRLNELKLQSIRSLYLATRSQKLAASKQHLRDSATAAMCAIDGFKQAYQMTDVEISLALGMTKSWVHQMRKAYRNGRMGSLAAVRIINKTKAYTAEHQQGAAA